MKVLSLKHRVKLYAYRALGGGHRPTSTKLPLASLVFFSIFFKIKGTDKNPRVCYSMRKLPEIGCSEDTCCITKKYCTMSTILQQKLNF